ncbi:unnamed protein product, partial [Gulo gulo]
MTPSANAQDRRGTHRPGLDLRAGGEGAVCDRRGVRHCPRPPQHAPGALPRAHWPVPSHGDHRRADAAAVYSSRPLQRQRRDPRDVQRERGRAGALRHLPVPGGQRQRGQRRLPGGGPVGREPQAGRGSPAVVGGDPRGALIPVQPPLRAGGAQEDGEGRALLLALRALRRLPLPGGRVHVRGLPRGYAAHAQPHGLPPHARRAPHLVLALGRAAPPAGRAGQHGHHHRRGHLRAPQQHAHRPRVGPRAQLRAAHRHLPHLRHHLPHGGRARGGRVRRPPALPRPGHHAQLLGPAHQDQPHLPHLRAG